MADRKPLEPKGGSPSQKDRLHAATEIQSPVKPEDYPLSEREGQTAVIGKGQAGGKGDVNK